jgi:hypothetical protein
MLTDFVLKKKLPLLAAFFMKYKVLTENLNLQPGNFRYSDLNIELLHSIVQMFV